jgi:hypothetical protein
MDGAIWGKRCAVLKQLCKIGAWFASVFGTRINVDIARFRVVVWRGEYIWGMDILSMPQLRVST